MSRPTIVIINLLYVFLTSGGLVSMISFESAAQSSIPSRCPVSFSKLFEKWEMDDDIYFHSPHHRVEDQKFNKVWVGAPRIETARQ